MWERRINSERPIHIDALITAFTAKREKNYLFHGETHDFWEMVYVAEGTAGFTADGKIFECSSGSVVFHKPNEFHRIWTASDAPITFTVVSFTAKGEYIREKLSNSVINLSSKGRKLISELQDIIENSGDNLYYIPENFREYKDPITIAKFFNILELLLYECAETKNNIAPKTSGDARLFAAAVKKMNDNISKPVKLQQIADELNVSLTHLKRVFNRYAMTGVHEYFLTLKIERAKVLLSQGEPVYKVAEAVGFYSQNYFSEAFKRETGYSPTKWVKLYE